MSKITIPFQDEVKFQRDLDAFCRLYRYQDTINGLPNTQTKAEFCAETLKRQFKDTSKNQRLIEAQKSIVIED